MNRRVAVIGLVGLVGLVGVISPAASASVSPAVQDNTTATPTPEETFEPPGPYAIDELRRGGDIPENAGDGAAGPPPSARTLPTGAVALLFQPVNPLVTRYKPVSPTQRITTDFLLARTSVFGDSVGEYELVVVFWDAETTEDGTAYAANQSVQRISFTASRAWGASVLKLRSHFDEPVQATAWLERNGQRVEGVRWRFVHETNPLAESPAYPIGTKGSIWRWASLNLLLPILSGIAVSGVGARHVLDRTVVGTLRGISFWIIFAGVVIGAAVAIGTWQTALVLANAPYAVGLLVGLLSFPIMMSIRDNDLSKAAFLKRKLHYDAVSPEGEETVGTREVVNRIKEPVVRDDTLYVPAKGIRPAIARYWASAAAVPREEWKSYDSGSGDLDYLFEVDPRADDVLDHTPAHLSFDPTLFVDPDPETLTDPPEKDGIAAVPAAISAEVSNWLARVNWRLVAVSVVGFAVIYAGTVAVIGSPVLGALLGTIPLVVESTEARDGSLDVDWGPSHWNEVQAQVQQERAEYSERKTFDEVLEILAELEWKQHESAEEVVERVRTKIQQAREEEHGGNYGPASADSGDALPEVSADD